MFKKYDYVYAVYKEKSFTKAAEKLFISQPSLSAAVKNIENKIGAPLFERSGHGAILTEVGEEYIVACKKMISAENDFVAKLHDIYNLESGHIAVGGTNYLSSYIIPGIINRFKALYPKIDVTLFEAKSLTLSEMLKNDEIDIILDSFDTVPDTFFGSPLKKEKIFLCVPASWGINKGLEEYRIFPGDIYNNRKLHTISPVPIDAFRACDFVLLKSGNDMHLRAMKIFEESNICPKVSFSVDQLNISYALTESGMGACFQTDTFFRYTNFGDKVCLYKLSSVHAARTLYITYNKHKYVTNAMNRFIDVAKEIIK